MVAQDGQDVVVAGEHPDLHDLAPVDRVVLAQLLVDGVGVGAQARVEGVEVWHGLPPLMSVFMLARGEASAVARMNLHPTLRRRWRFFALSIISGSSALRRRRFEPVVGQHAGPLQAGGRICIETPPH